MDNSISAKHSFTLQDLWAEFASVVLYLSEIIWVSAIFCILFNYPNQTGRVGLMIGLLGFGGYVITRVLFSLKVKNQLQPIIFIVWIIFSIFLFLKVVIYSNTSLTLFEMIVEPFRKLSAATALQSQLWQLIVLVLVVRRSYTLSSSSPHTWRAVRSFQIGMLMFLLYGLTTSWGHIVENLVPFLLYLVAILLAMSTSRLAELVANQNSQTAVFKSSWLLGMLSLALFTVLIGSLIGYLMGITFVNFTAQILRVFYGIGIVFLIILFSPLIALIALLIPWLNDLLASIIGSRFGLEQLEFIQSLNQPDPEKAAIFTEQVNKGLVYILLVALFIIVIAAIFGVRNRRRKIEAKGKEELEDLIRGQVARGKLKFKSNLFQSAMDQARRWLAAARIRRIYQQLMEYSAKLDTPRLPACTPLEFMPQLISLFPNHERELQLITDTYLKVRYGELPENIEEMQKIYNSWVEIKSLAEIQIKERKKRIMQK